MYSDPHPGLILCSNGGPGSSLSVVINNAEAKRHYHRPTQTISSSGFPTLVNHTKSGRRMDVH